MRRISLSIFTLLMLSSSSLVAEDLRYQATRIAPWKLQQPWALEALPDGRWLVTERAGSVVLIGGEQRIVRIPLALPELYVAGQGGLLDLALAQDFSLSGRVLMTFAQGTASSNHLAVATATFKNDSFSDINVVYTVSPDKDTPVHYGGRLAVLDDGTWLVTAGDGFDYREQAQVKASELGKILRIREDGAAPLDNPYPDYPYVYSFGHRNPQGLVVDESTGMIYENEHGPAGGDEINVIKPGANYGWPVATHGLDYSGARISPFTTYAGMVDPVYQWTPSVAPSSMALYQSDAFPSLYGQLLVTTLKAQTVIAVDLAASPVQTREIFATINQRLRDIAVDKNGEIYVLTDGEDATVFRIAPH